MRRGRFRLPAALSGQPQIGAAAKPFGRYAFDMPMTHQNDFRHAFVHLGLLCGAISPE